ncbi:hypothetical protein OG516_37605 [Streptomyces murinus]|nr:hypothetical protein OG516_00135 [Streptomyces murinus]WSI89864.1 hypothetical protein OG516_37605 [Streptomyces murinus]
MVPYEKEAGHVLAADAEAVRARLVRTAASVYHRVSNSTGASRTGPGAPIWSSTVSW